MGAVFDTFVPLPDFPFAGDGSGEGRPSPRDLFTSEEQACESGTGGLAPSRTCSPSALPVTAPSHDGDPITVHEFLQGVTSKSGRKYGHSNRLGTVKLDVARSEDRSPTPAPRPAESRGERRVSGISRIQLKHAPRRVPHLQRKKHLAKSLVQRLFEADVFSSGTSSRPTAQDPAHISSRQPLQFVTSSNLTPSSESWVRKRREVEGAGQGSPAQMLGVSGSPATSRNAASDEPPSRSGAATTQRARTGSSGAVLASRRKVFRARGGKQSLARLLPGPPFEYVPLPFMQVKTHQGAVPSQYPVACSGLGSHTGAKASSFNVL
jgi:hypothetical protein